MMLKRIEAPTLQEALSKVQAECGKDALLVDTQETHRGFVVVASSPHAKIPKRVEREPKWTKGFAPLAKRATRFGISDNVLRAVEKALIGTQVRVDRVDDPALPRVAAKVMQALVKTSATPSAHVTAFVGPTGVGKTTTLAKIAANALRDAGESVAIVTIDTYRMAAVEQLRALAEMLDVPFEVALTPIDLKRIVAQFESVDRVLIDTTGRSPFDQRALHTLRATLKTCKPHVELCLAANSRRSDAAAVYDGFRTVGCDSVILTKWDETRTPGEALSFAIEHALPLSHVTLGQEIPDDIVAADAAALTASALAADERELEHLL
ncbi:MAG: hypothetical protein KDB80_09005 [Planctomycetes bacterium]|nr:hypothetical protein [Planctomycetota bacterium]